MMALKKKINLYRRYPDWRKAGAIFIHVPKVAGTSISHALYGKTLGHYRALDICKKFPSLYDESYVFSFIRDPLERLYSAYNFAKKGRTESMGVADPEQYKIPEFESFESFVLDWLKDKDVNSLDNIFKEQSLYVCDLESNIIVDDIYNLNNIDRDMKSISRKLGKNINVPKKNVTNKSGYKQDSVYSHEMKLVAMKIYKNDYEVLGLDGVK